MNLRGERRKMVRMPWAAAMAMGCIMLAAAAFAGPNVARRGFASVAREASPAVVFIQVEKTVQVGVPSQQVPFNDPFDFFGDDFLRRFFGGPPRGGPRQSPRSYRQTGQGTGFIVREDGYILTNNHVVGDADKIRVRLHDGREFDAERVGTDPRTEVAVIKIDADSLPTVKIGSTTDLEIGEWVVAIGNPFGLSETLTAGVVSAKGRTNIGIADFEDFIQTDAAINPGNSGGPLLNVDSEVVGINTAIYSRSGGYMGIGFAIPIEMAVDVMTQLIESGRVTRGYLGVHLNPSEVDERMAESFGLDAPGGILLAEIMADSPADDAGLQPGDIILEMDGNTVSDNNAFRRLVASLIPGSTVNLTVFRDGQRLKMPVTIGTFPDEDSEDAEKEAADRVIEKLGINVQPLSRELAQRFGYETDEGVIISDVKGGSRAERVGLRPGMLVVSINRRPVSTVKDFERAIKDGPRGQALLRVKNPEGRTWFVVLRMDD